MVNKRIQSDASDLLKKSYMIASNLDMSRIPEYLGYSSIHFSMHLAEKVEELNVQLPLCYNQHYLADEADDVISEFVKNFKNAKTLQLFHDGVACRQDYNCEFY